jgi:hypothetical protein
MTFSLQTTVTRRARAAMAAAILCSFVAVSAASADVLVPGIDSAPTDLGLFAAGSYDITASGTVSLAGNGAPLMVTNPDGTLPSTPLIPGFSYLFPNGSPFDIPDGNITGPGGSTFDLGALLGTLNPSPTSAADFFLIGYGTEIALSTSEHIYALVNDPVYADNSGAYDVVVTAAPEPASLTLLGVGLFVLWTIQRRGPASAGGTAKATLVSRSAARSHG